MGVRWLSLLSAYQNPQEAGYNRDCWAPSSNSVGVEEEPQVCISNKFPGDAQSQGSVVYLLSQVSTVKWGKQ